MSDENKNEECDSVVDSLLGTAVALSPAITWGMVLGPVGFIAGAAAMAATFHASGHDGSPRRPDPNDPA